MPRSRSVLEDSIRLAWIRRIKVILYIVQTIVLVSIAMALAFLVGGAKMKPSLYLPLDLFSAVIALLLLVICIESFYFRVTEIRFARSSSARHLMAKTSIRRGLLIAAVTAVITVVLMVPPILGAAEEAASKTVSVSSAVDFSFWSRDPLALQQVSELRASASSTVNLYLVDDDVYQRYYGSMGDMYSMRLNRDQYVVQAAAVLTIQVPDGEHRLYHLVVDDHANPGTYVEVELVKKTSEVFTGIVALLALAFVVANSAWVAYLVPIERKYAHGSIYK